MPVRYPRAEDVFLSRAGISPRLVLAPRPAAQNESFLGGDFITSYFVTTSSGVTYSRHGMKAPHHEKHPLTSPYGVVYNID